MKIILNTLFKEEKRKKNIFHLSGEKLVIVHEQNATINFRQYFCRS